MAIPFQYDSLMDTLGTLGKSHGSHFGPAPVPPTPGPTPDPTPTWLLPGSYFSSTLRVSGPHP